MLDSTDITTILATSKPSICAYLAVYWDADDSAENRYYSDSPYQEMSGFLDIGLDLEPVIKSGGQSLAEAVTFEINPDLKSEQIEFVFDNVADDDGVRPISDRFASFSSGVTCEVFFYYADVNEHQSVWFGQLQAGKDATQDQYKAIATNGFRSRELLLPHRMRPRECTSNYGGSLDTAEAIATNGCPVDVHTGGSIGNGDLSCARDSVTTCNTKCGTSDGKYFLGFDTDASATVTSGNPRVGPAISKGNQSSLTKPIRVIYGQKYVREMPLLLWRREVGAPDPNHDWVSAVSEVGEGPVQQIYELTVLGDRTPQAVATQIRLGSRGQAAISNYAATMSNFSCTALVRWKYGWINAGQTSASDLTCEGRVIGMTTVPVYTDSSTFTRIWSDNRAWCLFDLMTHQRYGLRYAHSRFNIDDWISVGDWTLNTVSFVALDLDGNSQTFASRRSTFDAVCEGRPVLEQIEDICRSGGFSMPFISNGKFSIKAFRKATSSELTNAVVFTDNYNGTGRQIHWEGNRPAISFSQVPEDKINNEIQLEFEEADNKDVARPITVDDPNQKLKAGRALGENNLHTVNKKFSAFGIRYKEEAARLAYRLLWFGEHDSGGTQNNLSGTFRTDYVNVLDVERYDIIKLDTTLDDNIPVGTSNGTTSLAEVPEYYRVLGIKKLARGAAEVRVQVYNQPAYELFDNVTSDDPPVFNVCSIDADCPDGYVCINGRCVHEPPPPPCLLSFASTPTHDAGNDIIAIAINPC